MPIGVNLSGFVSIKRQRVMVKSGFQLSVEGGEDWRQSSWLFGLIVYLSNEKAIIKVWGIGQKQWNEFMPDDVLRVKEVSCQIKLGQTLLNKKAQNLGVIAVDTSIRTNALSGDVPAERLYKFVVS